MAAHSKLPSAEAFNKLVFEEILPTIRKTGSYHADNSDFANTLEIQIAEVAARMLSMSDTDKIKMFATIYEEKGISTKFLPSYSDKTHKHLED
jgi:prophage antirepressor-like protein